jgi:hypothetical protein
MTKSCFLFWMGVSRLQPESERRFATQTLAAHGALFQKNTEKGHLNDRLTLALQAMSFQWSLGNSDSQMAAILSWREIRRCLHMTKEQLGSYMIAGMEPTNM